MKSGNVIKQPCLFNMSITNTGFTDYPTRVREFLPHSFCTSCGTLLLAPKTAAMPSLMYTHPKKYGQGSRKW